MMFIVRKIFRNNKQFTNYICSSSILNDKKFNKENISSEKCDEQNAKEQRKSTLKENPNNLSVDASSNSNTNYSKSKKKGIKPTASVFQHDPVKKAAASLVKDVAKEMGGDKKKISEDLLNYLKALDVLDAYLAMKRNKEPLHCDKKIPVDHEKMSFYSHRSSGLMKSLQKQEKEAKKKLIYMKKISLPLRSMMPNVGIFSQNILKARDQVKLKIWDDLEAEELSFRSKRSPKNYFEELINWTNEGRLWHFPIDNDQGLDEEAKISFTEHIFMEQYLEPWCPQKGPVRKFMELVLIGLSKNPHLTVEEKKSHIEWFSNYFENKKKLLQELGAMGPPKEIEVPKQEQKESS